MDENTGQTEIATLPSKKKKIGVSRLFNKTFLEAWIALIFAMTSIGIIAVNQNSSEAASSSPCGPGVTYMGMLNGEPLCTHGEDKIQTQSKNAQRTLTTEVGATATNGIYCGGTGTDGKRFQAVYAYTNDRVDRKSTVTPQYIIPTINNIDQLFSASSAHTGGFRQVRWVTDASCNLNVMTIRLNFSTAQWVNMPLATRAQTMLGYASDPNRKYAFWIDAASDEATSNFAVGPVAVSAAQVSWWIPGGQNAMAHEVMHTLGAVTASAPNSTGAGHCNDGVDVMCYNDGGPRGTQRNVCSIIYYDCNHDDYFYAGTPPTGNYLASSPAANTANSPFLSAAPSGPPTTTTTTTTRPPGAVRPANDNFASATVIPYAPTSQLNGTNVNATAETGEPSHAGNRAAKSIWYSWTPTISGTFHVKTHTDSGPSSNFDTVVAVYKQGPTSQFNQLVLIASNDNFNGRIQSKAILNTIAGKRYWIAIDGKNGASGTTVLQIKKL